MEKASSLKPENTPPRAFSMLGSRKLLTLMIKERRKTASREIKIKIKIMEIRMVESPETAKRVMTLRKKPKHIARKIRGWSFRLSAKSLKEKRKLKMNSTRKRIVKSGLIGKPLERLIRIIRIGCIKEVTFYATI